jgi:hypothetical protein
MFKLKIAKRNKHAALNSFVLRFHLSDLKIQFMKKFSVLSGLFAGFVGITAMNSALAMPAVGDDVIFSSVGATTGTTTTGTFEMKLASYDSNSGKWLEKQITTQNGVSKDQNQQIPTSALLTDSNVALILANCAVMKGTLQTITVPAGNFSTCAIPSTSEFSNGTLWIAKGVVFGIAQEDFFLPDGTHTVLQLVSQTIGQH